MVKLRYIEQGRELLRVRRFGLLSRETIPSSTRPVAAGTHGVSALPVRCGPGYTKRHSQSERSPSTTRPGLLEEALME